MRAFFIQHVDALITLAAGLWLSFYSWRRRESLRSNPNKLVRALPVMAPLLVVFGLLRFAIDTHPTYAWQRLTTRDQQASAEFPCAATAKTTTNSALGTPIQTVTLSCEVPRRDITLLLSYNEIPPEFTGLTIEERLDGMKEHFVQTGFAIASCTPDDHGAVQGYRLVMEKNGGAIRCVVRIAVAANAIYRVVASSATGFHDDPIIARFIGSFRLR